MKLHQWFLRKIAKRQTNRQIDEKTQTPEREYILVLVLNFVLCNEKVII